MTLKETPRAIYAISLAVLATIALAVLSAVIGQQSAESIPLYFLYQGITLILAVAIILLLKLAKPKFDYLKVGNLSAPTSPAKLLGIKSTDNWRSVGLTFAVIISVVTGVFLYFTFAEQLPTIQLSSWLLAFAIAIPLSVSNAFTEEIVTRWVIVEGMTGKYAKLAPWISALIFGGVHYLGIPGGILGSIMAAFLAWFSARSIQDTKGIGWAWFLHFLQDILIFTITIALFI